MLGLFCAFGMASAGWESQEIIADNASNGEITSYSNQGWCVATTASGNDRYVHVVYFVDTAGLFDRDSVIKFRRKVNGTWESPQLISESNDKDDYHPLVVTGGSYVHVAWIDDNDVSYRRNTNNGASGSWENIQVGVASEGGVYNDVISLAANKGGDTVFLAYVGPGAMGGTVDLLCDIGVRSGNGQWNWSYLAYSMDYCSNPFTTYFPLFSAAYEQDSGYCLVAWDTYNEGSVTNVVRIRRWRGGWNEAITLRDPDGDTTCTKPCVAVSENYAVVVWEESAENGTRLRYRYSTNCGFSWLNDIYNLTADSGCTDPNVALSGNTIRAVFAKGTTSPDIYYVKTTLGSGSLISPTLLSDASKTSCRASIAKDADGYHHVVYSSRPAFGTDMNVYYRETDNASTTPPPPQEDGSAITANLISKRTVSFTCDLPGESDLLLYDSGGRLMKQIRVAQGEKLIWSSEPGVYFYDLKSAEGKHVLGKVLITD